MSRDVALSLAVEIRREFEQSNESFRTAVEHAVRCGTLLTEAKAHLKHGEWGAWVDGHFPASRRTAQGYMRLAQHSEKAQALADLGVEGALKQLAAPKPAPTLAELEQTVKSGLANMRAALSSIRERKDHTALGYPSWEAFVRAEFRFPEDHGINEMLMGTLLAMGDEPGGPTERRKP